MKTKHVKYANRYYLGRTCELYDDLGHDAIPSFEYCYDCFNDEYWSVLRDEEGELENLLAQLDSGAKFKADIAWRFMDRPFDMQLIDRILETDGIDCTDMNYSYETYLTAVYAQKFEYENDGVADKLLELAFQWNWDKESILDFWSECLLGYDEDNPKLEPVSDWLEDSHADFLEKPHKNQS